MIDLISIIAIAAVARDVPSIDIYTDYPVYTDGSMTKLVLNPEVMLSLSIQGMLCAFLAVDVVALFLEELYCKSNKDADVFVSVMQIRMFSYAIGASLLKTAVDVSSGIIYFQPLFLSAILVAGCMLCGMLFYGLLFRDTFYAWCCYAVGAYLLIGSFVITIQNFSHYASGGHVPDFVKWIFALLILFYFSFGLVPLIHTVLPPNRAVVISLVLYIILSVCAKNPVGWITAYGYVART